MAELSQVCTCLPISQREACTSCVNQVGPQCGITSNQIVSGDGDIVGLAESCFENSREPPQGRHDERAKHGDFAETESVVKPVSVSTRLGMTLAELGEMLEHCLVNKQM